MDIEDRIRILESYNNVILGTNKCKAIAKLCNKHKVSFLGIQETHSLKIDPFKVKRSWGNFQFDFAECPSNGRSGGLVSIWDPNAFSKLNVFPFENILIVEGNWTSIHTHCFMINVYAPQEDKKKETLWHNILDFKDRNPGHYFIFGDFNVVRYASERIGTIFNPTSANVFNKFIQDAHLWDIPLGGHLFTRINKRGDKLSKLDRFLITESSTSLLYNFSAQVLDSIVNEFWEQHATENSSNPTVTLKNKMKALKPFIKAWSSNRITSQTRDKEDLIKIKDFDDNIANGTGDVLVDSQ
ncbi:RNA-directed DNA polymerase, eukaryota, reverse transcriptase zinc-binding domain protein [Tanacetum coccineum]